MSRWKKECATMKVMCEPSLLKAFEVEHGRNHFQGLCVLNAQHFQFVQSLCRNGDHFSLGQVTGITEEQLNVNEQDEFILLHLITVLARRPSPRTRSHECPLISCCLSGSCKDQTETKRLFSLSLSTIYEAFTHNLAIDDPWKAFSPTLVKSLFAKILQGIFD